VFDYLRAKPEMNSPHLAGERNLLRLINGILQMAHLALYIRIDAIGNGANESRELA